MTKEQAIEKAAQLWCDPRVSDRVMDPEFCEVIAEALTATSVKVPSEELIIQRCREIAQLIVDHKDQSITVGGVEDLLYSLVRGLFPNPEWAIKRMQEEENE